MRRRTLRRTLLWVVLIGALAGAGTLWWRNAPRPPSAGARRRLDLIARHHRGLAHLYRHEFVEAARVFEALARDLPGDSAPWIHLAIAHLNGQRPEDVAAAEEALARAGKLAPGEPRVPYLRGVIHAYRGELDEAVAALERARELAPADAGVHYRLGNALKSAGRVEEALPHLEASAVAEPGLLGAWNALAQVYRRLGRRADAADALRRFQHLRATHRGHLNADVFTEMGALGEPILRWAPEPAATPEDLPAISFAEPREIPGAGGPFAPVDIACAFGPGTSGTLGARARQHAELWCGGSHPGAFDLAPSTPTRLRDIPALADARAFALGDIDEDGRADLVACGGAGSGADGVAVTLFRARPPDAATGADAGRAPTLGFLTGEPLPGVAAAAVRLADIDLEGDLDLVASPAGAGSVRIVINTGRKLDPTVELEGGAGAAEKTATALAGLHLLELADLDGDGDVELIGARDGHLVRVDNDPEWALRELPWEAKPASPASGRGVCAAVAADLDGDGDLELAVAGEAGGIWWNEGRGDMAGPPTETVTLSGARALAIADLDLDGRPEVIAVHADTTVVLRNLGAGDLRPEPVKLPGGTRLCAFDADGDLDPDLVIDTAAAGDASGGRGARGETGVRADVRRGPRLLFLRNTSDPLRAVPPHHALVLALGGVRDAVDRRTNLLGLGAHIRVQAGDLATTARRDSGAGGGAQGLVPTVVGVGPRDAVELVLLRWTDGVVQAESELPVDRLVRIEETQRKSSSCPLLFTWDGEGMRFVTDFLGGGGLGFWVAPGRAAPPDPDEVVRIPPGALVPRGEELVVSVMEPMQEVAYIDALRLVAVDHPAGTAVFPDERFAGAGPPPTGAALIVKRAHLLTPVAAQVDGGPDRTASLTAVDRDTVGPPALDPDLVGFARPHVLELDFGPLARRADATPADDVRLLLNGWVEYPYSRTNFAASQGAKSLVPPKMRWRASVDAPWQLLDRELGYPAGMPKTMVADVSAAARAGARHFRIETNMEIYWDRIALAAVAPAPPGAIHSLPTPHALLRFGGYPREYSDDGALPLTYHYRERSPHIPFRTLAGATTAHGEASDLIARPDGHHAILAGGDELLLRFDARALPPLADGMRRTYLLRAVGYCKDADPLTIGGRSVGPLPTRP